MTERRSFFDPDPEETDPGRTRRRSGEAPAPGTGDEGPARRTGDEGPAHRAGDDRPTRRPPTDQPSRRSGERRPPAEESSSAQTIPPTRSKPHPRQSASPEARSGPSRQVATRRAHPLGGHDESEGGTPALRRSWKRRALLLGWWGIQIVLGVIFGAVLFDRVLMPLVVRQGQEVVVPAVAGLSLERARSLMDDAGLEPVEGPGKFSPLIGPGQVLEASPSGGLSVKKGRQVHLTPSLGTENRQVPDVEGLSLRLAGVRLQELGLQVGNVDYASTDRIRPGEVVATTPPPGSPLPTAGTVSLLLAREKAPVPFWMPDLSGRPGIETAAWLEACGFKAEIEESSFPGTAGTVLRQRPDAGEPIWPGDLVQIIVARESGSEYDRGFGDDDRRRNGQRPGR